MVSHFLFSLAMQAVMLKLAMRAESDQRVHVERATVARAEQERPLPNSGFIEERSAQYTYMTTGEDAVQVSFLAKILMKTRATEFG